ncbi:hypothetical protein BGZ93_011373 [Podila epicladia]|nr:hypothetical protein BGZ92_007715 [Podila epicladia]KAG0098470.1 hypothetical protein BGZ93_011373 [Podila epicladia]
MTDYWHSFSAPPQPRDLEEHLPTDTIISPSIVCTPSPISTSTSSSSSQRTIVETGSLLKSSVRCASEQGLLLAQRSKTSLNRLLDTVMDNATTLAESSSANCAYSDSEDKPSLLTESIPTHARISPSSRQPSRAKFFVCDSDEEEEDEEEEEFLFPRRSEDNFGDYEDSGTDEAEAEEEEESLGMKAPSTPSPMPVPGIVRRQSLLSDLFLAEKQREQLHPNKSTQPSLARTSSTYLSHCPSAANSDGESTFARMAPVPEDHQDLSQHHHRRRHHPHRITLDVGSEIQEPEKPKSPLVRTKRVFKNLDELASLSTTSPTCNISSPSSPSSSSPSSSAPNSTSPTALAAWTRSHQVQVQIQSLVVQSTSSAQRALLSASATLTDVLFRTK